MCVREASPDNVSSAVQAELQRCGVGADPIAYSSVLCVPLTGQQFGQQVQSVSGCSCSSTIGCRAVDSMTFVPVLLQTTHISGVPVTRLYLPVSDHSSLDELLRFLALTKPVKAVALDRSANDLTRFLPVGPAARLITV